MRDAAEKLGGALARAVDAAKTRVPTLDRTPFSRTAEIPIYIIHQSRDPEDYVFVFDFQAFMAQSRKGWFVRPTLRLWAGRGDFDRAVFARALREAFQHQFALMAQARVDAIDEQERPKRGWFGVLLGSDVPLRWINLTLVQTALLWAAVVAGATVWTQVRRLISARTLRRAQTDLSALRAEIDEKRAEIDAALKEIKISLHRDLYVHAWRDGAPGPMTGLDYDAWPLPRYVIDHLDDRESSAWW